MNTTNVYIKERCLEYCGRVFDYHEKNDYYMIVLFDNYKYIVLKALNNQVFSDILCGSIDKRGYYEFTLNKKNKWINSIYAVIICWYEKNLDNYKKFYFCQNWYEKINYSGDIILLDEKLLI